MDECERFIDPRYQPMIYELPIGVTDRQGETRCSACGAGTLEQLGRATVACAIRAVVGYGQDALVLQASDVVCVDDDFEPDGFRCSACGIEGDLDAIAESRPWTIGARALLPDGSEARIQAIGPDRVVGRHREPTAICAGATYLVRDLRTIDPVHAEQLALPI
jgi:hypothetical protein